MRGREKERERERERERESRFAYFLASRGVCFSRAGAMSASVNLFPLFLIQSFLENCSYHSIAGSHKQVQLCRYPGGLKWALLIVGLLKMGCWVQLMTESFKVFFHPRGISSLCSCLNLIETFGKFP